MKRKLLLLVALLLAIGSINAQDHWSMDSGEYADARPFTGQVLIDNVAQTSTDIEVAAFVGNQVRAVKRLTQGPPFAGGIYVIQFNIKFTTAGEAVSFKIYDHVTLVEYDNCTVTLSGGPVSITTGMDNPGSVTAPVILNFSTTTTLPIAAYTPNTSDGWYLIASPLNATTAPTSVGGMTTPDYDLYYFDQAQEKEWVNYKPGDGNVNPGFSLVPLKGYLYANSSDVTLIFTGAPYAGTNEVTLVRESSVAHADMAGWNLIGNSFNAVKSIGATSYYRMNPEGRSELILGEGNIAAMEGIFVYAENGGETVTFADPDPSKRSVEEDRVALNLLGDGGNTIDRIIVGFDDRTVLPKYCMHDNSTVIYVPQSDRDYAVVRGTETSVLPVSFRTQEFGTYTLSADLAGAQVSYMHLIDRLTGEDVDMLLDGEYSFVGAPGDLQERFILSLTYNGNFNGDSSVFVYQNGSDIVVCGDGTLQVFDVMGRFVSSQEIHGVETVEALPMGVYIMRMVGGDSVRTQKIYVK